MRRFVIFVDMMDSMNYKVNALEFRLKRDAKLEALRKLDMEIVVENTIETDSDLRAKRESRNERRPRHSCRRII